MINIEDGVDNTSTIPHISYEKGSEVLQAKTDFTVSAWIKPAGGTGSHAIMTAHVSHLKFQFGYKYMGVTAAVTYNDDLEGYTGEKAFIFLGNVFVILDSSLYGSYKRPITDINGIFVLWSAPHWSSSCFCFLFLVACVYRFVMWACVWIDFMSVCDFFGYV